MSLKLRSFFQTILDIKIFFPIFIFQHRYNESVFLINTEREIFSNLGFIGTLFFQRKDFKSNFFPKKQFPKELFSKETISSGTFYQRNNFSKNFFPKKQFQQGFFSKETILTRTFFQRNNFNRKFFPMGYFEVWTVYLNCCICMILVIKCGFTSSSMGQRYCKRLSMCPELESVDNLISLAGENYLAAMRLTQPLWARTR